MTVAFRLYRGLEIYPLVYPHRPTEPGFGHNYDEGFDASVRIQEGEAVQDPRSRVFGIAVARPFRSAGDARRASVAYAEHLIDTCLPGQTVLDMKS
ncbi:hypothetical protein ACFSHT_31830 [Paraburkholderia silviterrae]|uniref:Uncharacterized protein n=1 Tax=Paraburkholderia silviterrae TaxID=2528715 RepID=A0A4R5M3E4_9BURK|nr:hypothetical protein [Paraburkholderia silviterrae]TDG20128.1 hypothetical protein EYW47_26870 [Paraburkholderia silviterrae]